jgi:Uma2 family endonuclease
MAQPLLDPSERAVVYPVPRWSAAWAVPEVPVPESDTHDAALEWLRALLLSWVERTGRDVKVARNLGIRWVQEVPRYGFDPDLCLIEPAPDASEPLHSLRLWLPGHAPPTLAVEVVSPGHPYKDYVDTPERCAACGVQELWIYDPMLAGPRAHGGPHLLQIWRQRDGASFERISAGEGPTYSPLLHAWLHPEASRLPAGAKLHISDDQAGRERWVTAEQRAQRDAQHARANERQARANERRTRELLEREQRERLELLARLHDLEGRPQRK